MIPTVVAAGTIRGNLFESAIRWEFGARVAGTRPPGFGGLLDRIDSLLLVAPLPFYVIRLLDS
jgi:phosphatidate cytidylyltransferase